MNKVDTLNLLNEGFVEVTFNKVNGDERVMTCTLQEEYMAPMRTTNTKKPVEGNQVVYDINAEGCRTFKWENVTKVNGKAFVKEQIEADGFITKHPPLPKDAA